MHTYCACTVHMLTHFTILCLRWLRSRCLPNLCQSDIWWLTTARRNSYQPVLVCIYHNCAIVEAWLPFMTCRICIFRTLLARLKFSVHDMCNCGAIAVITSATYMTIMELFDEYPGPFSPERMMVVIDHDTNIYILNDMMLSTETERSTEACC